MLQVQENFLMLYTIVSIFFVVYWFLLNSVNSLTSPNGLKLFSQILYNEKFVWAWYKKMR